MDNRIHTIGISCIGSGVGQSVISSLRLSGLPFKTVGLGTNPFAYGAYDCDAYDYTKSIYDDGFIDNLIQTCVMHGVDLVIPGLDDEAMLYAENMTRFDAAGIKAIVAGRELISICRDKERMSNELNKIADVFVKNYKREELISDIGIVGVTYPLIAKPRGGFASRGIEIIKNRKDLEKISDDCIIQELAVPVKTDPNYDFYMSQIAKNRNPQVSEISIQLVYSPDGQQMGRMFSYNKLNNGIPIEIVPYESDEVWSIIDRLIPTFLRMGLRGPLNIQGRFTEQGLKLFEMNPRFTGITGLRALMGFNEVEACVKEWLGIDKGKNQLRFNYNRFGVRQTADKSIPIERNRQVMELSKRLNCDEIKKQKTILITGACGYLGRNLIQSIADDENFEIWAYGRDKERAKSLLSLSRGEYYDSADLQTGRVHLGNVDILLHMGFTRPHGTDAEIAESLKFTHQLFTKAVAHHVPVIINISSQSIYGLSTPPPWTEQTPVAPQSVYAQAKYATELLLASLGETNRSLRFCSLRLGTLAGDAPDRIAVDFVTKIGRKAISGAPITIIGGMQQMQRLDVRDAVDAIVTMLKSPSDTWNTVYNLGSGQVYSLLDLANRTVAIAAKYNGGIRSEIIVEEKEVLMKYGMDSNLFYSDFSWSPRYSIDDTIDFITRQIQQDKRDKNLENRYI
jgi:nucleoside-diphosphate-sugar epimerase